MRRLAKVIVAATLLLAGCSGVPPLQTVPPAATAIPSPASQPGPAAPQPGAQPSGTALPLADPKPPGNQEGQQGRKPESKPPTAPDTPAPGTQAGQTPPAGQGAHQPRLAILVYHDVDDRLSNAYTVTSAQLESQVKMLLEEGYAFYHLADVERLLAGGQGMPEKAVLLAFDDGYTSFYTHVMPIARKYHVPATGFVVTKYLDQVVVESRPHMSNGQTRELAASPLADLAGHSYDGHREGITADGSKQPALTHRIRKEGSEAVESELEYQNRVRGDFVKTALILRKHGVTTGLRHFTFPYTARSDEAVRLGQQAGFEYFYIGGGRLVTPQTERTAIPRVHAGAPEITAEVLRDRLRNLFDQP